MNRQPGLFSSTVGLKIVMAVSGAILALFLVAHVVGNLEIFGGPDAINHYGELLRTLPPALWAVRLVLLLMVVLHAWSAIRLWLLNRAARPVGYRKQRHLTTTIAARTMLVSGIVLAYFVVFHILHFTVRSIEPSYKEMHDAQGRHDVYRMVTDAFSNRRVAAFYVVSVVLLGLHLSHGAASMIHTLGASHPRYRPSLRWLGPVVAILIAAGFAAVPLAILAGLVRHPTGGM
jgi:succinate dehydrogenase / fumarate reductase cytochrome b subunit